MSFLSVFLFANADSFWRATYGIFMLPNSENTPLKFKKHICSFQLMPTLLSLTKFMSYSCCEVTCDRCRLLLCHFRLMQAVAN